MKHCSSCNINIDNPLVNCPLCYTTLTKKDNKPEYYRYPNISQTKQTYDLFLKILVFISVTIIATCFTINYLVDFEYHWWLIVAISVVYVWVLLLTAVRRRSRIGANVMMQLIALIALFLFLGNMIIGFDKVVYNYILPTIIASAIFSFNIIAIVQRHEIQNFLVYYLVVATIGFLPLTLYFLKVSQVGWVAIICAVYSFLSIIAIFIFGFNKTKDELHKRLHI